MHVPLPTLRVAGMLVILAALLLGGCLTRPEYELGAFAVAMNIVVIDRLACAGMNPDWDDNAVLAATVLSRLAGLLRASVAPRPDPLPGALADTAWCLLGLFCTWNARDPAPQDRWLPWYLALVCLLLTGCTHAELEPAWRHALRGGAFGVLAVTLHSEALPAGSLARRRGFLVCFGPVLLVDWVLAWAFVAAASCILVQQELAGPAGEGYELLEPA